MAVDVRLSLNSCGFGTHVPSAEPTQPMDIYPLMINCNGFYVGRASWSRHREKFLGFSMTGFLRSRFRRMLRKEEFLNRFFYLEFDPTVFKKHKAHHERIRRDHGDPSTSGLKYPKEEPAEEMTLDLENRRYNFYLRPTGAECSLV